MDRARRMAREKAASASAGLSGAQRKHAYDKAYRTTMREEQPPEKKNEWEKARLKRDRKQEREIENKRYREAQARASLRPLAPAPRREPVEGS